MSTRAIFSLTARGTSALAAAWLQRCSPAPSGSPSPIPQTWSRCTSVALAIHYSRSRWLWDAAGSHFSHRAAGSCVLAASTSTQHQREVSAKYRMPSLPGRVHRCACRRQATAGQQPPGCKQLQRWPLQQRPRGLCRPCPPTAAPPARTGRFWPTRASCTGCTEGAYLCSPAPCTQLLWNLAPKPGGTHCEPSAC